MTFYWIPAIPIGGAEPFVQCDQCQATWDVGVLTMDRAEHEAAQESQFCEEAIRSAVLITLDDGKISEAEIEALLEISRRLLGHPIDREELGRLCSIAREINIQPEHYVLTVSKRWSPPQRIRALQAMFLAATSDDGLTPKRTEVLSKMRDLLELTNSEYQAAIQDAIEGM